MRKHKSKDKPRKDVKKKAKDQALKLVRDRLREYYTGRGFYVKRVKIDGDGFCHVYFGEGKGPLGLTSVKLNTQTIKELVK
jgi:hypothetical protein